MAPTGSANSQAGTSSQGPYFAPTVTPPEFDASGQEELNAEDADPVPSYDGSYLPGAPQGPQAQTPSQPPNTDPMHQIALQRAQVDALIRQAKEQNSKRFRVNRFMSDTRKKFLPRGRKGDGDDGPGGGGTAA